MGILDSLKKTAVDSLKKAAAAASNTAAASSPNSAAAAKLKYSGSAADGSAEKNLWLHAELLKALAQNGGKIPSYLL